jgi:hypothetical protein
MGDGGSVYAPHVTFNITGENAKEIADEVEARMHEIADAALIPRSSTTTGQ